MKGFFLRLFYDGFGNINYGEPAGGGPPPPPATVTAANEGVSLTGTTVKWGQSIGQFGNPAELLGAREIDMNSQFVYLRNHGALKMTANTFLTREQDSTSTEYNFDFVVPQNYAPVGGIDLYRSWLNTAFHNPASGRIDVIASWHSYNFASGGSPIQAGEAAFAFKSEQFYEQDATTLFEFHLPEIIDDAGQAHRLWSIYTHRPDGVAYIQSQVQNVDFRPSYDNSGLSSWLNFQTDNVFGTVQVEINASLGTGGTGGTKANYARLVFVDGTGNSTRWHMANGNAILESTFDFVMQARTFQCINWIRFNQTSGSGVSDVIFEGFDNTAAHGFILYDFNQANRLARFSLQQCELWGNTIMVENGSCAGTFTINYPFPNFYQTMALLNINASSATIAHINLAPGVTKTTPVDGDIWYDGANLKMRVGGVTKTFTLV